MLKEGSLIGKKRASFIPTLPQVLSNIKKLHPEKEENPTIPIKHATALREIFPKTFKQPLIKFSERDEPYTDQALTVGVVFSGGPAAGGHNVIAGIYDSLKKIHPESRLIGFIGGPKGIIENQSTILNEEIIAPYRNQGGFDLIGTGREKIEKESDFQAAEQTVKQQKLDGLVIIGGDDSNTNAALLAEYFLDRGVNCRVIGVPKTIDGDLQNDYVEISFGFDTATKTYSELIGNLQRDALSANKYYFFVKLMGRSASHIALECAHNTHPNITLIGEEIAAEQKTFEQIIKEIADIICQRALQEKNYGVILIPEGIIEFIPEFNVLISDLNSLLSPDKNHAVELEKKASNNEKIEYIASNLSNESRSCFLSLTPEIQRQLLLQRDAHGNVPVSKIETEKLFLDAVKNELIKRKSNNKYTGKFNAQALFYGYEGRCGYPTNFDTHYCYALGFAATLLIHVKCTGYMACICNLDQSPIDWGVMGVPLIPLMHIEERQGKAKPVIKKTLVNLTGKSFEHFKKDRMHWAINDDYQYPGPIQFFNLQE
ncbi:MAG: diphosphate--fructose-6-phosphate 1-phosphotransferase [Chlamydiales bacterium]